MSIEALSFDKLNFGEMSFDVAS